MKDKGKFYDQTVKELQRLKDIEGDNGGNNDEQISLTQSKTSFFSEVNGRKSGLKEEEKEVEKNGKLVAKLRQKVDLVDEKGKPKSVTTTEIEIPSKGIHDVILKNGENVEVLGNPSKKQKEVRRAGSMGIVTEMDKINSVSGTEYSPLDMAEYIFWTGDEKGVALTIEEFLEEGLMTRQEAINFLQSIKFNLDLMQQHYLGLQKTDEKMFSKLQGKVYDKDHREQYKDYENLRNLGKTKSDFLELHEHTKSLPYVLDSTNLNQYKSLSLVPKLKENVNLERLSRSNREKDEPDYTDWRNTNALEQKPSKKIFNGVLANDNDYEDIVERLKVADILYKEYSLEEVIYQLAKVMFSQSLTRDSKEAQKALQRFNNFLQQEVKYGEISKRLEEKILDVLVAALMDTLLAHPEVMAEAKNGLRKLTDPNSPIAGILKQLLVYDLENRSTDNLDFKANSAGKGLEEQKSIQTLVKKVD